MTSQRQFRRATTATQQGRTLAVGEPDYDTTKKRLYIHDGVKSGGIAHSNYMDVQDNSFIYGVGAGTDTITASMEFAPTAYTAGQKFIIKPANSITGASTLNVDGLGAKSIKKLSGASIVDTTENNIVANVPFEVIYDGTQFILLSTSTSPLTTGTFSAASAVSVIAPAGVDIFRIHFQAIPSSDGVEMNMKVNNSTAFGYRRVIQQKDSGGTDNSFESTSTGGTINVGGAGIGVGNSVAESGIGLTATIYNATSTTRHKNIKYEGTFEDTAGNCVRLDGSITWRGIAAVSTIDFGVNSGNLTGIYSVENLA